MSRCALSGTPGADVTAADGASPDLVISLILQTIGWMREVERDLGPVNTVFPPNRLGEIVRNSKDGLAALQKIHERCTEDPIAILDIFPIIRVINVAHLLEHFPELHTAEEKTIKCLTFKLRFDSTIVVTGTMGSLPTPRAPTRYPCGRSASAQRRSSRDRRGRDPLRRHGFPSRKTPMQRDKLVDRLHFQGEIYWGASQRLNLLYNPGTPPLQDLVTYSCPRNRLFRQQPWYSRTYGSASTGASIFPKSAEMGRVLRNRLEDDRPQGPVGHAD